MLNDNPTNALDLTFQYRPTFREFLGASFILSYKSWVIWLCTCILSLLALAIFMLVFLTKPNVIYEIWNFIGVLVIFIPTMICLVSIYQFKTLKKQVTEIQVNKNNLKLKQGSITSEIGWDNIIKVEKFDKVLGFYFAKNQSHFLPLRVVTDQQLQLILQIFQQAKNLNNANIYQNPPN